MVSSMFQVLSSKLTQFFRSTVPVKWHSSLITEQKINLVQVQPEQSAWHDAPGVTVWPEKVQVYLPGWLFAAVGQVVEDHKLAVGVAFRRLAILAQSA